MDKDQELHKVEDFSFIEEVKKLDLKPGDILVVKSNKSVSSKQMADIREGLRKLGIKNKAMVLEETMTIGILRRVKDSKKENET